MVIGGGGREHAIVSRLASEPDIEEIVCCPGNPGISTLARAVRADPLDLASLSLLARNERIDFTVVGPELPLSLGLADHFQARGQPVCGPSAAAARLESSKAFAKAFMDRHGIPTARYRVCDDLATAMAVVDSAELGFPLVLKADGLAAGKGVVIAADRVDAESATLAAMRDRRFGEAGARLVLEECLTGPEVSFFAVADGTRAVAIGTAQDHKRIFDGDQGPNTGGMGAFAPSPLVGQRLHDQIMRGIVEPVVSGMAAEGYPYHGFLYVGLILTAAGPKVIEFNVRLGDPEAQVVLPLLAQPLLPMLVAAASGRLPHEACLHLPETRVGVVLASRGYPESSEAGQSITGIDQADALPDVSVFHAGTARREGQIVTSGGRVLTVVGRGDDYGEAIARAYDGVRLISFDGMQYRRDIGRKALESTA
jgi:phosphoribosylamine--glycine ligase